jgi:uncharacterized membrane protein YoaT (DUF817 family)
VPFFTKTILLEIGSSYVAQAIQELEILLPHFPECWDYKCAPPILAKKKCCEIYYTYRQYMKYKQTPM